MEGEVKERAESRYGRAERKGQKRIRGKAGSQTHTHTYTEKWETTDEKQNNRDEGYSERSFLCPRQNMKGRKTGVVQQKQTKMSENNFLHSGDSSALTLVIKVRQPEHTVHPEVCGQNRVPYV